MLDKIVSFFSDPFWWITVAVTTIVLNLISRWVDLAISKSTSVLLRQWSARSESHREMRRRRIELMKTDRALFHYYIHQANLFYHSATIHYIGAGIGFVLLGLNHLEEPRSSLLVFLFPLPSILMGLLGIRYLFRGVELTKDIRTYLNTSKTTGSDQTPPDHA